MRSFYRTAALAAPTLAIFGLCALRAYAYPGDVFQTGGAASVVAPSLPGAAGDGSVSLRTGAAQYSYPISVPPGRNGVQPDLALTYSSNNPLRGGVAAGWQLHIPSIRVDTSRGRLAGTHYTSSLSGDQLVQVDEPVAGSGSVSYRGIEDNSYIRYEHYPSPGGPGWWKALAPNGVVYYFGETAESRDDSSSGGYGTSYRWFLTRMVDSFGNQAVYEYEKVWGKAVNGQLSMPVDIAVKRIGYSSNYAAGLEEHAEVLFEYAPDLELCPGSDIPIGSSFTFRSGLRIYEGARKLVEISIRAREQQGGMWSNRDRVALEYLDTAGCNQPQAPLRYLKSIKRRRDMLDASAVIMPEVSFTYGRVSRSVSAERHLADDGSGLTNVGRGLRRLSTDKAGGWPTIEQMWLDLDGDGLLDLAKSAPVPGQSSCGFLWKRNLGDGTFSPWNIGSLPTLPWANGTQRNESGERYVTEGCSLAAQFSRRENVAPGTTARCGTPANYTSYRFMDMNGDGRADLVTALDFQKGTYRPEYDSALAAVGAYPQCAGPLPCYAGDGVTRATCSTSPDLPPLFAPNDLIEDDQCGFEQCKHPGCTNNCVCDTSYCGKNFNGLGSIWSAPIDSPGNGFGGFAWPGEPYMTGPVGHENVPGYVPGTSPRCGQTPETHCGRYVWRIYLNEGGGVFAQTPEIRLSPIPLESDRATSRLGTSVLGPSSSWHGFIDIDGDGHVDAVWQDPLSDEYGWAPTGRFLVFRGDGNGNFVTDGNGKPYEWSTPPLSGRARVSLNASGTLSKATNGELHRFTESVVTLQDINGDGLPDYVHSGNVYGKPELRVYYNTGAGFENMAIVDGQAGTRLTEDFTTLSRDVQVVLRAQDSTDHLDSGWSISTLRPVDLDEDGLIDVAALSEPDGNQKNPYFLPKNKVPLTAYLNVGDRLIPVNSLSYWNWRSALGRLTVTSNGRWRVLSDYLDLDGDGLSDVFNNDGTVSACEPGWDDEVPALCGTGTAFGAHPEDGLGLRLLTKIDNGRGAITTFAYQRSVGLTRQAGQRRAAPSFVVASLSVNPGPTATGGPAPLAVTEYEYEGPVYARDRVGTMSFRGFERVTQTLPANSAGQRARVEQRYDYGAYYGGLPWRTVRYDHDHSPIDVREGAWGEFSLFSGAVKTLHPTESRYWLCDSSSKGATDPVAHCIANAPVRRDVQTWGAMSPWIPPTEVIQLPSSGTAIGGPAPGVGALLEHTPVTTVSLEAYPESSANAIAYVLLERRRSASLGGIEPGDRGASFKYRLVAGQWSYRILRRWVEQFAAGPDAQGTSWGAKVVTGREETVYDAQGRGLPEQIKRWQDADTVAVTKQEFDVATGNLVKVHTPRQVAEQTGRKTSLQYDSFKLRPSSSENEAGHKMAALYNNGLGVPVAMYGPHQGAKGWPSVRVKYDAEGRPRQVFRTRDSANGYQEVLVARMTYEDTVPAVSRVEYRIDYETDDWIRTYQKVDGLGRVIEEGIETDSGPAVTLYEYDALGKIVRYSVPSPKTDGAQEVYEYHYDTRGRLTLAEPPIGAPMAYVHDGLVTTRTELPTDATVPQPVRMEYDIFGRLERVTEQAATGEAVTEYQYDEDDNVRRIVDADGIITSMVHDWAGNRRAVTRNGRTWTYGYDLHGNMVLETLPHDGDATLDPLFTTVWTYDELDRVTSKTPGRGLLSDDQLERYGHGITLFEWDDDQTPNGVGRLASVVHPLAGTTNGTGRVDYRYSAEGWLAEETHGYEVSPLNNFAIPVVRTIRHEHNALGIPIRTQHADHPTQPTRTVTTVDERGMPRNLYAELGALNAPTLKLIAAVQRNRAGAPTLRTEPSGSHWHSMQYDELGRLIDHRVRRKTCQSTGFQPIPIFSLGTGLAPLKPKPSPKPSCTESTLTGETIAYDQVGNVNHLTNLHLGKTFSFSYDLQHQLVTAATTDGLTYSAIFEYTPGGRIDGAYVASSLPDADVFTRDVRYEYDQPEGAADPAAVRRLVSRSDDEEVVALDYDPRGNVTRRAVKGEPLLFYYDGDDQLREVVHENTGVREIFYYDHSGARVLAYRTAHEGEPARLRAWLGEAEVWLDDGGVQTRSIVHASLGGSPVANIVDGAAEAPQYTYTNGIGNLLVVLDNKGTVQAQFDYGPYGEVLAQSGAKADEFSRRFNGKEHDAFSGLSYYGARYYDQITMNWTQQDPLYQYSPQLAWGQPRRASLYTFSLNNPLRFYDPDGFDPSDSSDPLNDPGTIFIDIDLCPSADGDWMVACPSAGESRPSASAGSSQGSASASNTAEGNDGTAGGSRGGNGHYNAPMKPPSRWEKALIWTIEAFFPTSWEELAFDVGLGLATFGAGKLIGVVAKKFAPGAFRWLRRGEKACFVAGTLVSTSDGMIPIEQVQPGDLVLARDPGDGSLGFQPVLQTFEHSHIATLSIVFFDSDGKGAQLETTAEHPFWVVGEGWRTASELRPGDALVDASGRPLWIHSAESTGRRETVFNLEVKEFHTYFVGEELVWVHNRGCGDGEGIINRGGRFGDLDAAREAGEVAHHMPQNAYNRTIGRSRSDGPALGMSVEDHALTRTFAGRGKASMRRDAGLSARDRAARDIMDIRRLFGRKYNQGLREMLDYMRQLPEYRR